MTTTVEQKAVILCRWEAHRLERGLEADVKAQIRWNWRVSDDEAEAIYAAYQERKDMRPSAPKRTAKYTIKCTLGWRRLIEGFVEVEEARVFVEAVMHKRKYKWADDETITAADDNLQVHCAALEEIMDLPDKRWKGVELPDPLPNEIAAFLGGKWPVSRQAKQQGEFDGVGDALATDKRPRGKARIAHLAEDLPKAAREAAEDQGIIKKRANGGEEIVTLQELCEQLGVDTHAARVAMRRAKWDKPGDSWRWPASESEQLLKQLGLLIRK